MKLKDVRAIAMQYRIEPDGLTKSELIHKIQQQDGRLDCFATAIGGKCGRLQCLWRRECFDAAKARADAPVSHIHFSER